MSQSTQNTTQTEEFEITIYGNEYDLDSKEPNWKGPMNALQLMESGLELILHEDKDKGVLGGD